MEDHVLLQIGRKIKEIRNSKELTIAFLAKHSGISKGLLSRVENGRTVPSLPVLLSIIKALDIELSMFFEDLSTGSFSYILQRKEDYKPYHKDNSTGFNYFSILTDSFNGIVFQASLLKLEPGAKRDLVTTDGYEFIYLIKGEIGYVLDKNKLTMYEGDSLFFDGRIPHLKINNTEEVADILVIYMLTSK